MNYKRDTIHHQRDVTKRRILYNAEYCLSELRNNVTKCSPRYDRTTCALSVLFIFGIYRDVHVQVVVNTRDAYPTYRWNKSEFLFISVFSVHFCEWRNNYDYVPLNAHNNQTGIEIELNWIALNWINFEPTLFAQYNTIKTRQRQDKGKTKQQHGTHKTKHKSTYTFVTYTHLPQSQSQS